MTPDGERPSPAAPDHDPLKLWFWYLAMGPLEVAGRAAGVYRPPRGPMPDYPVTNQASAGGAATGPVVAFGDSLTQGYGLKHPARDAWPAVLGRRLGIDIVNRGRSGDTSADGLARLDADVLSLAPSAVVVGFGGNDMIRKRPVPDCFADLDMMVARIHATGAAVALLGIRGSWLFGLDFDTGFRELAMRRGCPLAPLILDGIWGAPWLMLDVAHPNARGHRMVAGRVEPALRRCLPEAGPTARAADLATGGNARPAAGV